MDYGIVPFCTSHSSQAFQFRIEHSITKAKTWTNNWNTCLDFFLSTNLSLSLSDHSNLTMCFHPLSLSFTVSWIWPPNYLKTELYIVGHILRNMFVSSILMSSREHHWSMATWKRPSAIRWKQWIAHAMCRKLSATQRNWNTFHIGRISMKRERKTSKKNPRKSIPLHNHFVIIM